ncbi:MAG TPA: ABC transporter substrate-binding protein [Burkholderiales bacterium]
MRRTFLLAVVAAFALGALPAHAQQEFKIGVIASMSGGFTGPAKDTIDGWQAWQKAHGLPGKKIVVETLDDETNPVSASNAFRRIASDPSINLIYLFIPSNSVMAVKSLASEFKVPIIAGGAADAIGVPADPWLFKVAPAVRDFMTVLTQYAQKKGYKRIASINAADAFGQAEITNLKALAPKTGLQVVAAETFGVEDTNFNAQLTRIRAAKPDLIYNGAAGRAAILTYRAFQQMGFKQPLVVTQAAIGKAFFEALGSPAAADGLMTPMQSGVFGGAAAADSKLYAEMEKALGRTPVYFNTFGFDVGLITEYAVKNSDGSRQGLRDALERIKDLPAVNGPVTYTKEDHTGQNYRSIIMGQLKSGKPVPAN